MNPLQTSVVKTLAYFDISGYPLTKEELFEYLWQPPAMGYADFTEQLAGFAPVQIGTKWGYYFLAGREYNVENRRRRQVYSIQKQGVRGGM